jgi:hypothetical protein
MVSASGVSGLLAEVAKSISSNGMVVMLSFLEEWAVMFVTALILGSEIWLKGQLYRFLSLEWRELYLAQPQYYLDLKKQLVVSWYLFRCQSINP